MVRDSQPDDEKTLSIRRDLWSAFTRPGENSRWYDKKHDSVLWREPKDKNDVIQISPIALDVQKAWARDFSNDRSLKNEDIIATLNKDGAWLHDFQAKLNEINQLDGWENIRTQKIFGIMRSWSEVNGLKLQIELKKSEEKERAIQRKTQRLRGIVMRAVSRMSLSDLRKLRIPGYCFEKEM